MKPLQRLLVAALVAIGLIAPIGSVTGSTVGAQSPPAPVAAPVLDLETLTAPAAIEMMENGQLTSVQLTQAYIDRIDALNKEGPGLNAVTQLNRYALDEAAVMDAERAAGTIRGPSHGLPALLKDLIDVKGMYTSNGNYSLRSSYPEEDAGMVKKLRASGVVILGKTGLSEFANSFGSQPSGFSNLTGQVVHGLDADQNPSGSSSGTGAAGAAALSMFTVGTETSGSIISPATAESLVGIRPTVGLVPAYGIGPISSSQDTAGPMDRTVANAAMHLQAMAGRDLKNEAGYESVFGPNWRDSIKQAPDEVPDYLSALDLEFVRGKRIGYNGTFDPGTPAATAFAALESAGAIMVPREQIAVGTVPALPAGYQQHKAINEYYANLGPNAPIKSLAEEVADNQANSQQALKFGNQNHVNSLAADVSPGGENETAYRAAMPIRRAAQWSAIDRMMGNETPDDPSDDFLAILGSVPSGATAGTPQITIPMGYNATTRRAQAVSIHGNAMSERNLIGVAYVIEQVTQLRQTASSLNPSMYRCADTVPAAPYAERGSCNPDFDSMMGLLGGEPTILPFSVETESASSLQARMTAGELSASTLTKAYITRIGLTNAAGPALQAVRSVNANALADAAALDQERAAQGPRGPLHGIPVLLDDSIDVAGLPTTAGSIALQDSMPTVDSTIVTKLKAAGAIILGKTNVTELNGLFDAAIPEGYSSLGGQVMLPSDTDKTTAGSSAGAAAATAAGLAAITIGRETSTDTAQMIAPAGVAGVVGLKPTVGLVSRAGMMPVASSQDSTGPITRSVVDAATQLQIVAGEDPLDPATAGATSTDYLSGLSPTALSGKRVAVVDNTTGPYPAMVTAIQGLGASTVVTAAATPEPNPASVVTTEFERDLNAYLAGTGGTGAKSLAEIIAYNSANSVEGTKYQQGELVAAEAVDLSDPATAATYEADLAAGQTSSRALLDSVFTSGTAGDTADDVAVIAVPSGNALVGVADRAGYPVLTVPAGYGTGNAGRNPIGITFIGKAFDEAGLLSAGYALEQATNVRLAPSFTNPSMFRCVPGSTFFTAERCHPGDPYFSLAASAEAPSAVDDSFVAELDTVIEAPSPGVLGNDGGSGLTAELEASTATGSLNFRADGSFTYVPAPGFAGTASFTYRAVSATGRSTVATVTLTTLAPNVAPTAALQVTPTTGNAPLAVVADGSGSTDPDGQIVSYAWDFGNGQTGTGATASTTYPTPGTYVVTLVVTDDRGATSTATTPVTVTAAPVVKDQVSLRFSGARSYSFNGPISGGDLKITRDVFGVSRISGTATYPGVNSGQATVTFNLTRVLLFNSYVGTVTVKDPSVSGFGSVNTPATFTPLSGSGSTASGALYGSVNLFKPYTFRFEVKDLA